MRLTRKLILATYAVAIGMYLILHYGIPGKIVPQMISLTSSYMEIDVSRDTRNKSPEVRHIAFLKVHKSGSSTVQNILLRFGWYRQLTFVIPNNSSFYPNVISLSDTIKDNNILPRPPGKSFDILCCHVTYNRAAFKKYMPKDSVYIGIVRDPYRQFSSIIRYFRPANVLGANRNGTLTNFLKNPRKYEDAFVGYSMTNNRMAYEFGFPLHLFDTHDKVEIEKYLEELDKDFQLVIVNEYFDESLVLMRRLLNWQMKDILYISQNVDKRSENRWRQMSQSERVLYKKWAVLDFALYEHFVDRLWKQISYYGKDIFEEASYFKQLKFDINTFCSQRKSSYIVNKSPWNDVFVFTIDDCIYASMNEIAFLTGIRQSQYKEKSGMPSEARTKTITKSASPDKRLDECPDQNINWSFRCRRQCPKMEPLDSGDGRQRNQIVPVCDNESYTLMTTTVVDYNVPTFKFEDPCLDKIVAQNCIDQYIVPNVVHYVWFGRLKMNFYHFLAFMSAHKKISPCLIFLHADYLPIGPYWKYLLRIVPNIIQIVHQPFNSISGKRIKFIEHKADYARLLAVRRFGGMYTDTDTIVLRSLNPLRNFNFTLSKAFEYNLSNGLIISAKNATFLKYWFRAYESYDPDKWGFHSTIMPFKIWQAHLNETGLIHVEDKTFVKPNALDAPKQIFKENYIWIKNYAIHMFIRYNKTVHDFEDIRTLNTTVGSVSRFILLGSKELCYG